MRTQTILGVIFIAVMLITPLIFLVSNFNLMETGGETVTLIKTGSASPKKISISLGNGLVVIRKNVSVSGWKAVIEYKKDKEKPEIDYSNGELIIKLEDGKIMVEYNTTQGIHVDIVNGALNVIIVKNNISMDGSIINGNANFVLFKSNITINFKLTNGDISINAVATRLKGYLKLTNGHINAILEPLDGGTVYYSVDNGEAIVYPSSFNLTVTKTKNGENGTIQGEGDSLDVTLNVTNGGITIIVVPLKEMEEKP